MIPYFRYYRSEISSTQNKEQQCQIIHRLYFLGKFDISYSDSLKIVSE